MQLHFDGPKGLALALVLVGCAMPRSVTLPDPVPKAATAPATPYSVVVTRPTVDIDSNVNARWSQNDEAASELGIDMTRALGLTIAPTVQREVSLAFRVQERLRSSIPLKVLRVVVPIALGVAIGALSAQSVSDPCAGHDGPGEFCISDTSGAKAEYAVGGFGLGWTVAYLAMSLVPSEDVSYQTSAIVSVRDSHSGAMLFRQTVFAEHNDRLPNLLLPSKLDKALGLSLRKLEPKVAAAMVAGLQPPTPAMAWPPAPAPFAPAAVPTAPAPTPPALGPATTPPAPAAPVSAEPPPVPEASAPALGAGTRGSWPAHW